MPTLWWVSHVQVDRGIIGLKILSFRRDRMIGSSKKLCIIRHVFVTGVNFESESCFG